MCAVGFDPNGREASSQQTGDERLLGGWRGTGRFGVSSPSASTGLAAAPRGQRLAAGAMPHLFPPPVSTGIAMTIMACYDLLPKAIC